MIEPLVSVIMPTYNYGNWIAYAIKSILEQDYKRIELLIIDDNSQDDTPQIVERFFKIDQRVRYYNTNKRICNIAKLLNIGIKLSEGDIIARQDADDISLKNRICKQVELLEREDLHLIGAMFYILSPDGKLIKDERKIKKIYSSICIETVPLLHGTWMFGKSLIEKVGMYNENFPFAQDFEFLLRIGVKYKLITFNLPYFLYIWRLHDRNVSVACQNERYMYILRAKELYGIRNGTGEYIDKLGELNEA